jgi:superfamily II RNA helicase
MKQWFAAVLVAASSLLVPSLALANDFEDLRSEMTAARESLVTLVVNKDKRGTDQQKLVKESADKVSAHLGKMKAPSGKEAAFKELSETWAAFKKTRESELVPAVLAGRDDDAKKLVNGIQKERYTKCQQLVGDLGG